MELGHGQAVKDQRAVLQKAMRQRFNEVIEAETGSHGLTADLAADWLEAAADVADDLGCAS